VFFGGFGLVFDNRGFGDGLVGIRIRVVLVRSQGFVGGGVIEFGFVFATG
jgi:hypothetical protein